MLKKKKKKNLPSMKPVPGAKKFWDHCFKRAVHTIDQIHMLNLNSLLLGIR